VPETDHVDYVTANEIIRAIRERPGVVSRSRAAADTGRVAPSGAAANGDVGSDQPFFIFGSFLSPHKPFDPPSRYLDDEPEEPQPPLIPGDRSPSATEIQKLRKYRRAYRALVRFLDDQIGRVLDAVEQEGLADSTLVIFSSDHGEMLGDHMRLQKGSYYRESLSVPLAIRMPTASAAAASREPVGQRQSHHAAASRNPAGSAPEAADSFEAWRVPRPARNAAGGAFVHTPVELTDITATILDAAGLDPRTALSKPWPAFHDRVPCRSLLPVVRSATLAESPRATSEVAELRGPRDFSFSECGGLWQCIQDDEYKYVRELDYADPPAREILYHVASDPHEMQPHEVGDAKADGLSEHEHAELELMRARLQWVMDATPAAQLRWAPLAEEGERYSYPKGF
jgi:arylsulfatase A-like enzyme